ncbi:hypothetical protein Micbo1qcDRAFT_11951 [Microdochium bolleyi]|uniref:Uncharacterized protein n=1 Tax=Microdochium bolleyi TaxID=196109 RepID=A0A136IWV2_9PEZI|nr:hypothetical protein Micbo1qcDRAFT_11951 [Microdochium bolleyi]
MEPRLLVLLGATTLVLNSASRPLTKFYFSHITTRTWKQQHFSINLLALVFSSGATSPAGFAPSRAILCYYHHHYWRSHAWLALDSSWHLVAVDLQMPLTTMYARWGFLVLQKQAIRLTYLCKDGICLMVVLYLFGVDKSKERLDRRGNVWAR